MKPFQPINNLLYVYLKITNAFIEMVCVYVRKSNARLFRPRRSGERGEAAGRCGAAEGGERGGEQGERAGASREVQDGAGAGGGTEAGGGRRAGGRHPPGGVHRGEM